MALASAGGTGNKEELPALLVGGRFAGDHVLVPLVSFDGPVVEDQLRVAGSLSGPGSTVSVIDAAESEDTRTVLDDEDVDRVVEHFALSRSPRNPGFGYTRDIVAAVLRTVRRENVDTLVLPGASRAGRLRTGTIDRLAAHANCDVVVVNGRAGYDRIASILVPIAGGPHSGLATDIATAIASDRDAWIDVIHVVGDEASEAETQRATSLLETAAKRIRRPATTTTRVLQADSVVETIIEQSRCHDLTVLGAPTKHRLRRLLGPSTNRSVRAAAGSLVLSAKNNRTEGR